jgi:D-alanyl-D-alanine carboxypeptidase
MAAGAGRRRMGSYAIVAHALLAGLAFVAVSLPGAAHAQIGSDRYSSIVIDAASGNVLEAANPDAPRHPASLTKLMTLYLVFEALRDRRITLDEPVPVSPHAASMEPSKLGLVPSSRLTVEQGILGLVTKSANDAAAALGELLGGSEDRFAEMMTLRARALGMSHTTFTNASGLPDPDQWTTARDLAVLGRHMVSDFPAYYRYFSTPQFTYGRRVIFNHDNMLRSYPGVDGMKTGWTEASGHNLVTSAVHSNVRLIGVVLGAGSNGERDIHMAALLDQGFDRMDVPPERGGTLVARGAPSLAAPSLMASAHAATITPDRQSAARARALAAAWGIQVGSYASEKAAREAAFAARRAADGGEAHTESASQRGKTTWRAQVTGLSAGAAQEACSALARHRAPCIVLRPDPRQLASR